MINFEPPMSPEETQVYLKLAKSGNRLARDKLILSNGRLVITIVKSMIKSRKDFIDLAKDVISEGILGLSVAIHEYDLNSEASFPSYATYWIRCYISKYLLTNSSILHIPYTIFQDRNRDKESLSEYRRQALNEVKSLKILGRYMEGDEGPMDIFDTIPDTNNTISQGIRLRFDNLKVTDLCKNVMDLKFNQDFSNAEISTFLGVSRERIRQIVKTGLSKAKLTPMGSVNNRLGIELRDVGMLEGEANKLIRERLLWNECSSMPKRLRCKFHRSTKKWLAVDEGVEYDHASDLPKFFIKRQPYISLLTRWIKILTESKIPITYNISSPSVDEMYLEIKDSYKIQIGHGLDADKIYITNLLTGYQIICYGVTKTNLELKKVLTICKSIFT